MDKIRPKWNPWRHISQNRLFIKKLRLTENEWVGCSVWRSDIILFQSVLFQIWWLFSEYWVKIIFHWWKGTAFSFWWIIHSVECVYDRWKLDPLAANWEWSVHDQLSLISIATCHKGSVLDAKCKNLFNACLSPRHFGKFIWN